MDANDTTSETHVEDTPQVESFDAWIAAQTEAVKTAYASHVNGLKSALDAERAERKQFAKALKDATAQAEQGSAAQKALQEMTVTAEQAQRRALFAEEASRPDVACTNVRAAYLVASAEDLFTKTGDPDWRRIKEAAPELFGRKVPTANAGAGTQTPPSGQSMNQYIRRAAGRS